MIWIMILAEIICILSSKKVGRVCVEKMNIDYISRGVKSPAFLLPPNWKGVVKIDYY